MTMDPMSFDLDPSELLNGALTAVLFALPVAFVVAAAVTSGPRDLWNRSGLALGIGLIAGLLLAVARAFAGPFPLVTALTGAGMVLGLLCAAAAAIAVVVLGEGRTWTAALGTAACLLIGIGEPGRILAPMLVLTDSILVVLASLIVEGMALAALVGFLMAATGQARALQTGLAVAGAVAALLLTADVSLGLLEQALSRTVGDIPDLPILITILIALVIGGILGGIREYRRVDRARRPEHLSR